MFQYIQIGNRLIPVYGLCMMLGFVLSSVISGFRVRKRGGDVNSFIIVAACAIGCGLIGTKLLYILASYGIKQAILDLAAGDFSVIAGGGQVFYGGLIGGVIGGLAAIRLNKENVALYCEAIVPTIPLGHAIGRIGCFLGGCCYGMQCDGPLCIRYPGMEAAVFPLQLMEAAINIVLFIYLIWFTARKHKKFQVIYCYGLFYGLARFVLEFFRGDAIRGITAGLSTSQWISLSIMAVCLCLWLKNARAEDVRKQPL